MNNNQNRQISPITATKSFDDWVESRSTENLKEAARLANLSGDVDENINSHYELVARSLIFATGAKFSAKYLGNFDSVEEWGENETGVGVRGLIPVWRVRISTASGSMVVRFRGSINDGQRGVVSCSVYAVLACLMKNNPGSFDDFANEFGYFPLKSAAAFRHARRVWRGCVREFAGVCRLWNEADRARLMAIN